MTMAQLRGFVEATATAERAEFKMLTYASLMGARGDEENVNKILKAD